MQPILSEIHRVLVKNKKTVAVAESCTGGLLSTLLTQIPGSSGYFILGIVAYSNNAKESILKVTHKLILKKGAVSKEVAKKMASSARLLAKTDVGIGITGIAGPKGQTPQKPLGLVFIALESKNKRTCERFIFKGSRTKVRRKAALKALELLKLLLINTDA